MSTEQNATYEDIRHVTWTLPVLSFGFIKSTSAKPKSRATLHREFSDTYQSLVNPTLLLRLLNFST